MSKVGWQIKLRIKRIVSTLRHSNILKNVGMTESEMRSHGTGKKATGMRDERRRTKKSSLRGAEGQQNCHCEGEARGNLVFSKRQVDVGNTPGELKPRGTIKQVRQKMKASLLNCYIVKLLKNNVTMKQSFSQSLRARMGEAISRSQGNKNLNYQNKRAVKTYRGGLTPVVKLISHLPRGGGVSLRGLFSLIPKSKKWFKRHGRKLTMGAVAIIVALVMVPCTVWCMVVVGFQVPVPTKATSNSVTWTTQVCFEIIVIVLLATTLAGSSDFVKSLLVKSPFHSKD